MTGNSSPQARRAIPWRQRSGTWGSAVAAAIVDDDHVGALVVLAARHMAAERRRAAVLDRTQDLIRKRLKGRHWLCATRPRGRGRYPRPPALDGTRRRYAVGWSFLLFSLALLGFAGLRQKVERAFDAGDQAGRDERIERCGVQFVETEERLDDYDISAALQQVGREAVAQRVQRHALLDLGFIGRLVEQSAQLAGGQRLAQPAERKQTEF